jgi:hypothetical protein
MKEAGTVNETGFQPSLNGGTGRGSRTRTRRRRRGAVGEDREAYEGLVELVLMRDSWNPSL